MIALPFCVSLSQLSIKTRIETTYRHLQCFFPFCLSQLSIKTRIETAQDWQNHQLLACLSQLSIKTRIETSDAIWLTTEVTVWVSYPLKQGLKQFPRVPGRKSPAVWVSYPLKQGLKHAKGSGEVTDGSGLSQLSIKTRIETIDYDRAFFGQGRLSQLSIKTRIETYWDEPHRPFPLLVWVSYPLKQGLKL